MPSGSVKGGGGTTADEMNSNASVVSLSKRINPPLPSRRGAPPFLSSGSAFTSYVRRRGEPDGGGNDLQDSRNHYTNQVAVQSVLSPALECNPINNSADSDFSDSCYATMPSAATLAVAGRKLATSNGTFSHAGIRGPVKVSRPGGGTESDAAFTPSPPVTNQQQQNVDSNVSLALAHQTRIRTLYLGASGPAEGAKGSERNKNARRPDSSSSASSATDWEGSGHATVLRRGLAAHQQSNSSGPPMPQPRHKLPLVDSLRPLMPVYNNMSNLTAALGDILNGALDQSTSSDSEFERGFEMMKLRTAPVNKLKSGGGLGSNPRKMNPQLLDRLSVRSENSSGMKTTSLMNPANATMRSRLPVVSDHDEGSSSGMSSAGQQKLYLSANEALMECFADCGGGGAASGSSSSGIGDMKKEAAKALNKESSGGANKPGASYHHHHHPQQSIEMRGGSQSGGSQPTAGGSSQLQQKGGSEAIMMRQLNREMTPTISDVYHERNLGLGLAPSLSKLLLSKNYHEEMDSMMKAGGGGGSSSTNGTMSGAASSSSSSMKSTSTMIDSVAVADIDVVLPSQSPTTSNSTATPQHSGTNSGPGGPGSGGQLCPMCNSTESVCTCNKIMTMATTVVTTGPGSQQQVKKPSSKPWLSNVNTNLVNASDLTTADILERQKFKSTAAISGEDEIIVESCAKSVTGNESPQFSELSRRDEGDGRSVADSNCSGSFKIDQQTAAGAAAAPQSANNKAGPVKGTDLVAINVQK